MRDYVIFTDSGCDISLELLEKWNVRSTDLAFKFRFSDDNKEYSNYDMPLNDFYGKMREGGVAKTSALNSENFYSAFEKAIKEGYDVLYLGFSSGLSSTFNQSCTACKRLAEAYPDAKVIAVDTLAASAGQGLLIRLVLDKKIAGATIEEAAEYARNTATHICHWFTVDDLVYLKRGGRISAVSAFFGNAIGIKPVLHVDNDGHLINVQKVRGRKSAIATIVQKYDELAVDKEHGTVFICHADCFKDASDLAETIRAKYGITVEVIADIGPVIGSHSGPGTLALFFVGKER